MIYLDNSATSFPKPKGMVEAMEDCLLKYCGNPGRSGHSMSMRTGEEVYKARRQLASLFNIENADHIIFTKNTTEALNLGIKGLLREGDHVVTTSMEHNSVLRPLKELEKFGISHTIVSGNKEGYVSQGSMESAIKKNTRLVVLNYAANTTGTIQPIKDIGTCAHNKGCIFMVDAAQAAGAYPIDVLEDEIDIMAAAGHKSLLGPQGTGLLYVSSNCDIAPILDGGTGTDSRNRKQPREFPEGFEAGTINAPAIIGLGFSAKYIEKIRVEVISNYEKELIALLQEGLGNMKGVELYGPVDPHKKTGVCLFNLEKRSCEEVTSLLNNEKEIMVRGGYHCAGLAHKTIGTWDRGAVRISVSPFNTRKEIKQTINAIYDLTKVQ